MTDTAQNTVERIVSFDDEPLIRVDEHDNVIGHASKTACHDGDGLLHRAFSIFLFNPQGELLLQQRSDQKRLWPGYWSNSCCSHPRRGESDTDAAARRIREELGLTPALRYLFKFQYHAQFGELGAEHELCSIYAAVSEQTARVNVNEIQACKFIAPDVLDRQIETRPEAYTPWLRLEWPRIRDGYWPQVRGLIDS